MPETQDSDEVRIGQDDTDSVVPFAGLTRYDDDVDAMVLPETVWTQQSSMKYWAQNKVQHQFEGEDLAEQDLDPEVLPEEGLSTLIDGLPRATDVPVALLHPRTGEPMRTLKSKAVVNPERLEHIGADPDGDSFGNHAEVAEALFGGDRDEVAASIQEKLGGNYDHPVREGLKQHFSEEVVGAIMEVETADDALYQIPTSSYTIVNPSQFLRPLCRVLREREWGDKVFGEIRLTRGDGRATLDLFIDGHHVESPALADDREPIVVGLEVNWDFFGDWAVRACGQGLDWRCDNRISRLTDREIVKHTGDVESRQDWENWFASILDSLEEKRDQLSRIIQMASEETLDFSALPDDLDGQFDDEVGPWSALYSYMGLPDYLAQHAGDRLRAEAEDPYQPDWWEIHSAGTYAVTHEARGGRTGGAFEDYARVANDCLFNPASMEDRIVENYEADRIEDEQDTLAEEHAGLVQIENAFESVRDKKETFEQRQDDLREMGIEI